MTVVLVNSTFIRTKEVDEYDTKLVLRNANYQGRQYEEITVPFTSILFYGKEKEK